MTQLPAIRTGSVIFVLAILLASCVVPPREDAIFEDDATQLQIRSVQTREYDMADRIRVMRAVIATLLDLDFVIDEADSDLGVITATRMSGYLLSVTVLVTEKDDARLQVRARMQTGWTPLAETAVHELRKSDAVPDDSYQEFFYSLSKNLSLTSLWSPLPARSAAGSTAGAGGKSQKEIREGEPAATSGAVRK
mgnify:FL=1